MHLLFHQSGPQINCPTPRSQRLTSARTLTLALGLIVTFIAGCGGEATSVSSSGAQASMTGSKEAMVLIKGGVLKTQPIADFYLDRTEVTVEAYARCVRAERCITPPESKGINYHYEERKDHPVNGLNFEMAQRYCAWAGKRLPSRREWQWAAQGREEGRLYPWGEMEATCEYTVFHEMNKTGLKAFSTRGRGCGKDRTAPVGSRPKGASRDGLLDMAGNVFEWTNTTRDGHPIMCGGSWSSFSDQGMIKTSFAYAAKPSRKHVGYGVRCAGTP